MIIHLDFSHLWLLRKKNGFKDIQLTVQVWTKIECTSYQVHNTYTEQTNVFQDCFSSFYSGSLPFCPLSMQRFGQPVHFPWLYDKLIVQQERKKNYHWRIKLAIIYLFWCLISSFFVPFSLQIEVYKWNCLTGKFAISCEA